jgi:hypothetical protein
MEEQERLAKLKQDAIDNPAKKKKGCKDCKKGKEINEPLPLPEEINIFDDVPTKEDIIVAYNNLCRMGGPRDEDKPLIQKVFIFLFGSEFNFGCKSCGNKQFSLITNYVKSMK